jgi:Protein of unknown function (DUF2845)
MRSFFILLLTGLSFAASADDMRCTYGNVYRGLTPWEVHQRCGGAVFEQTRMEHREPGYYVHVDEWIYDQGTNKFQRLLQFENGRLRRIELLDKPRGVSPRY